jgi:hypothetical protein
MFDGAADPCRQRAVVGIGVAADFLEQICWEADWNDLREPRRPASARRSLRFLVFWLGVVVALLLRGRWRVHRSLRDRFARFWAAS